MYRLLLLLPLAACAAHADTPAQVECSSFPVRSTTAIAPFQAPADLSAARVNPTRLPPGWSPVGASVGEGGAYVVACRPVTGPPTP
jgi:hypothetical protein